MLPEDPACISFEEGQDDAERQIKLLCTRILPGWTDLGVDQMQVSRISGGISNLLVKVEPPAPLHPVAVKVFGDKTELLIDRHVERHTLLRLNELGFGAKVVALFSNGRVEEFLEAHTLTPDQMADPRFIPHIAARMRAFHELDMREAVAAATATAANATAPAPAGLSDSCSSSQWDPLYGWLEMAKGLSFPHDPAKQAAFDRVDFAAVSSELATLRAMCDRVRSPRVFCHNDLLPGNILIVRPQPQKAASAPQWQEDEQDSGKGEQDGGPAAAAAVPPPKRARLEEAAATDGAAERLAGSGGGGEEGSPAVDAAAEAADHGGSKQEAEAEGQDVLTGGSLQFIDFEYSCYGFRGFDFGNHFNEYAGFDCVYDSFPSPEQQKLFFRHYLRPGELLRLAEARVAAAAGGPSGAPAEQLQAPAPAAEPASTEPAATKSAAAAVAAAEDAVLDELVAEACVFALLSHACWGVWSYVQARYSPIEFDYLEYAEMRWAEYHRRKAEFFGMVERLFPEDGVSGRLPA